MVLIRYFVNNYIKNIRYSRMQNKNSNNPDYDSSNKVKKENKSITCKDGYCFIPNLEGNETINNENINIFDPI